MSDSVVIPAFPVPLRRLNAPEPCEADGYDRLVVGAAAGTDLFVDPADGARRDTAPALVGGLDGDFRVSALVRAGMSAAFDAAVLLVYASPDAWAKLCLESSPQGRPTIVSVVNRGVSDDCTSFAVDPRSEDVRLRVSRLGSAYAFHARVGEGPWELIRYFALCESAEVGFSVQSPTGSGATARFEEIAYSAERLADVRDGS
ncbi:DUF1349 domain-containing protein [Streptomonospora salina]|uniref:Regulation of enolase protein 1 (Concanavalin A-like superfamily) n=1 Tax=Streptomonospora salina TaxID=104205 RepID=A0A841E844_9ACTN|nr:DUF1349 domain-containing protein [Streptomonospora salina]MBB5998654.1 regulation of enolase protein 1 (concanavalin A-like superfamily) [Streptomonospora salina]